jgi:hypothetical protein
MVQSQSVHSLFCWTIRLVVIALLSIITISRASACEIEQGSWNRGAADEKNFRHITMGMYEGCPKRSYSGFDDWGGVVEVTSPTPGLLHCGYLSVNLDAFSGEAIPKGWEYYSYDTRAQTVTMVAANGQPNPVHYPVIPSVPCQEQFQIKIKDGGGYITTALYFVLVDQKDKTCSPAGYSCASTANCCPGLTCYLRKEGGVNVGTCH